MKKITYKSIGVIHSPFKDTKGMPIQSSAAQGIKATIDLNPEYAAGLKDLAGFSHIILLYHFHRSKGYSLKVRPFLDKNRHGVFATRAPRRPNPIGISVVKLLNLTGNVLEIEDVDILDGTPLLDIKPYVPAFDVKRAKRIGWLTKTVNRVYVTKADERFKAKKPRNAIK
jgi:tRNA-Thr(GGU) m(6)t(6)A37 methyltransferase TsaA